MGMRMLWSIQSQGSGNPAIVLRKVEHVLNLRPSGYGSRPWNDLSQFIQFFSALEADTWEAAVAEALELAARYSGQWALTLSPGRIQASTVEQKVADVARLSFELTAAQYYRCEVEFMV
jgi:hypothetical protein